MTANHPVRQAFGADTPVQLLGRPVDALLTVTDEQVVALRSLGIRTVLDLGASLLFGTAVRITADDGGRRSPGDLVDDDVVAQAGERLPDRKVEVLRAVDDAAATAFRDLFGIVTIRELAAWPPYSAAARIVADAYGDPGGTGGDPERPDDLVPVSRRYATERVQYDVIVLDTVLDAPEGRREVRGQPPVEPQDIRAAGGIDVGDLVSATMVALPATGAVLTFRQSWFPQGLALGQLLHSTALSPGESTRIALVDWTRQVRGSTSDVTTQLEQVASDVARTRALSEVSTAVAREAQSGFSESASEAMQRQQATSYGESKAELETAGLFGSIGASLFGGSLGGPKVSSFGSSTAVSSSSGWASSSSSSQGERSLTADLMQNVSDRTQQAASSTRSRRATTVVETSQHEAESLTTRSVTNYNHMHALTVQYFEVVQIHRVVLELARLTPCLFVPMKLVSFDERVVRRYKTVIAAAGLTSEVRMLGAAEPDRFVLGGRGLVGGWDRQNLAELGQALDGPVAQPGDAVATLPLDGLRLIAVGSSGEEFGAQISAVVVVLGNGRRITRPVVDRAEAHNAWIPRFAADLTGVAPRDVAAIALVRKDAAAAEAQFPITLSFDVDRPGGRPASAEIDIPALALSCPVLVEPGAEVAVFLAGVTVGSARLLEHLEENALHYSTAIWRSLDAATITTLLATYRIDDKRLIEVIDPIPVTVSGNYLVFRYHGLSDEAYTALRDKLIGESTGPSEDLVPLPSGGVFAEAVLGRSNSAEKLDITRFSNWQDSPIPILPPEINPLTAGGKDNAPTPQTGALDAPVVNIVNPPGLPDPAGLAPVYQALANGSMFRDMSGLAQTAALLQTAIQAAQTGAADATQAAGQAQSVAAQQLTELLKLAAQVALTAVTGGAGGALGAAAGALGSAGGAGVERTATNAGALINHGREMDRRSDGAGAAAPGGAAGAGAAGGGAAGGAPVNGGPPPPQGAPPSTHEQAAFGSALGGGLTGIPSAVLGAVLGQTGQTGAGGAGAGGSANRTDWNVYLFVIGTDNQGGSNFNVMREWRLAHVDLAEPSVVVTFDFRAGELRKSWRESADRQPRTQKMALSADFDVVYGDIEAAGSYGRIRELHFLTHFGDDRVWFQPHRASSAAELAGRSAAKFGAAFAPDALVKVHGCQHDEKLIGRIRAFCASGGSQGGPALRREIQGRLASSYPVVLSRMAGVPVWASPMGAAAFYSCSYLPADEKGKRFCVETDSSLAQSYGNTVGFYENNYTAFFQRADGEAVFDDTRHMKYKATALSGSPTMKPCGP